MGMYFIITPIYTFYQTEYECDNLKTTSLKKQQEKYCIKVNVNIMYDYLVKSTKSIVVGHEIKTFYDWY